MKKILSIVLVLCSLLVFSEDYEVLSPDGNMKLTVSMTKNISWSVAYKGETVILPSIISMTITDDKVLGKNPLVRQTMNRVIDNTISPVVPTKYLSIHDHANELEIQFKGSYSVAFRVYNDGAAYRFITNLNDKLLVLDEESIVNFPDQSNVFFPEESSFISHYERVYTDTLLQAINAGQFCSLPVLVTTANGVWVVISETDLFDHPNMFFYGTGKDALKATFPKVPLIVKPGRYPDRDMIIEKEADYIAETEGKRSFPWRVFVITDDDRKLVESTLTFQLARPLAIENTAWIKPGKVAWDWWNAWNIYGVDFEAGINTETYKYYIDFASEYGIEYIILDEGWSKTTDLFEIIPEIDLGEIIRYGKEKNVGIILWTLWKPLDDNMKEIFDHYARMGVVGFKVDFMQRADQRMVNYYERVAREAAKRELIIDFHGAYKPSGLRRAYPNVLTYEGVKGLENCKWGDLITPGHDVTIPFIRMLAGPMDYTPGAMIHAQENNFEPSFTRPMSQGTRCHQAAMYVVYESPLQMLCDNPSNYQKEPIYTSFIAQIPVTWDETRVLEANVGEYIIIARRKGNNWYIGGMTDWNEREFEISLDFLANSTYKIEYLEDGVNANRYASDYVKKTAEITKDSRLKIKMAKGGGYLATLTPASAGAGH